jgi:hypothetical protein
MLHRFLFLCPYSTIAGPSDTFSGLYLHRQRIGWLGLEFGLSTVRMQEETTICDMLLVSSMLHAKDSKIVC